MIWMAGIVVAGLLFVSFPRAMLALLGVAGLAIAAVVVHQAKEAERFRAEQDAVLVTVKIDTDACADPTYPVRVDLANYASRRTKEVSFVVAAFKPQHSKPIVEGRYSSDRIMGSGGMFAGCWPIPTRYGEAAMAIEAARALEWRAERGHVTFD